MRLDHLLSKRKGKASCVRCRTGLSLSDNSVVLNRFYSFFLSWYFYMEWSVNADFPSHGELAQLARASALQAECQGFKSPILHLPKVQLWCTFGLVFEKHREGKHNDWRGSFHESGNWLKLWRNFWGPSEDVHAWAHAERKGLREAEIIIWSSEYRSMADALELRGEEGRDKLR